MNDFQKIALSEGLEVAPGFHIIGILVTTLGESGRHAMLCASVLHRSARVSDLHKLTISQANKPGARPPVFREKLVKTTGIGSRDQTAIPLNSHNFNSSTCNS